LSLLPDMLRAPELKLRDVLSNIRITRTALRFTEEDVPGLDSVTGLELLRAHGATDRMIDWFWRLASMAVMNVPLERCSAAALMRVHSQLIGHRGLHFGFPTAGLSELYVPQASRSIAKAGGEVRLDNEVTAVDSSGAAHLVTTRRGDAFRARVLVLAVPPGDLGRLSPRLANTAVFEPSPYKSVYLWFDRPIAGERFWTLLWHPERLNYDFYDLSRIRESVHGGASLIGSNIIFSHRAANMSDDEIVAATLRELATVMPASADARLLHHDVHHVPMAIPCPFPGTEAQRPETATRVRRLFLAGDWTRTRLPCSMEGAVRSGYLAAEACLAEVVGKPTAIAIEPRPNDGLAGAVQRSSKPAA
jgi:15-cis-phytoene desaturase